jgi:hypothetical protein
MRSLTELPDAHGFVAAAGRHALAVGRDREAEHLSGMLELAHLLARGDVPEFTSPPRFQSPLPVIKVPQSAVNATAHTSLS